MGGNEVTPRLALLALDENENLGDDMAAAESLVNELIASNIVAVTARMTRLEARQAEVERQLEQQRRVINKMLIRFQNNGQPISAEEIHAA